MVRLRVNVVVDKVEPLNLHEKITCLGLGVVFHLTGNDFAHKAYQPLLRRIVVVLLLLALRNLVPRLENHISIQMTFKSNDQIYGLP